MHVGAYALEAALVVYALTATFGSAGIGWSSQGGSVANFHTSWAVSTESGLVWRGAYGTGHVILEGASATPGYWQALTGIPVLNSAAVANAPGVVWCGSTCLGSAINAVPVVGTFSGDQRFHGPRPSGRGREPLRGPRCPTANDPKSISDANLPEAQMCRASIILYCDNDFAFSFVSALRECGLRIEVITDDNEHNRRLNLYSQVKVFSENIMIFVRGFPPQPPGERNKGNGRNALLLQYDRKDETRYPNEFKDLLLFIKSALLIHGAEEE